VNNKVKLQYLSNSGFILTTEEGKRIIIDPYLTNNPRAPFGPEKIPKIDLVLVTHAAFEHLGDSFYLANCGEREGGVCGIDKYVLVNKLYYLLTRL